ncbi:SusD-like starch-binding protein associating with outer membrane [Tenacibaculum lutimaris]|uniref:SusD-like starch-binding protein associating with outer membrane n=1 Tax=Tenacibaculum lutimaris TaxID=285258 RepID=A0A420E2X7_9FLAO|nr:RagB/SusD family nutrient uptake outer membrane protein [Tenacibaculum lutimaris]RKF04501.1 SusD-like starch-binding protein associating with outer membrane [Tenacibaculum lutimaris]
MKNILKYTLIGALLIGFTSCSNEFLDEPVPTGSVSDKVTYTTESGVDAALTGMFAVLRDYRASHDTWGGKAYYLGADVMGTDLMVPGFNWYIFEHRWDVTENSNGRRANWAWELFYSVANISRTHVIGVTSSTLPEDKKKAYISELKAVEAYCYFNLVRYYSGSYLLGDSKPGIPLYTATINSDVKPTGRGTIKETYDRIITQLEEAVPNMSNSLSKYRFNKSVAEGLLARVYLEVGNWAKAAEYAAKAKRGYTLMDTKTYTQGFNTINNDEWMWALPFNASQQPGAPRFFSFIDHNTSGYNDIYVSKDFQALFTSDTDIRKSLIVSTGSTNSTTSFVTEKFRDLADRSGDLVFMRASEMYLIEAEAKAEMNDLPGAKNVLLELLKSRDTAAALSSAATKEALVDEILIERRKELYGELGVSWFDLKRRNQAISRKGEAHRWPVEFEAGNARWNFKIPQAEIDKNPNISEADQN